MRKMMIWLGAVLLAGSVMGAEMRWDFMMSPDAAAGETKSSPLTPAKIVDGALDATGAPVAYKLPAAMPAGQGMIRYRFRLEAPIEKNKEYGVLDLMAGGNGLRIWIDRNANFDCDLRDQWKNVFWWSTPASRLKVGEWIELTFAWSDGNVQIAMDGKVIFEKKNVKLPARWGDTVVFGAFGDRKAHCPLRVSSLTISPNKPEPKKETPRVSTYVKPEKATVKPVFGLNIHTRDSDRELPTIVGTDCRRVRFHYSWNEAERVKGKLELPQSAFNFMNSLDRHGLSALMILAYGNKHYNAPGTPSGFDELKGQSGNQAFLDGFGRYAEYMVRTFGSPGTRQVREWEVWNEQNGGTAEEYMAVLRVAAASIRKADPSAKIIFGGISRMDHEFILKCFQSGAGELVDAVAIHPYRESEAPEDPFQSQRRFGGKTANYAQELRTMRETIRKYSPAGKDIPLWITEFGYWTTDAQPSLDPANAISHDVQAKYLLRSMIQNLALGVDNYYWYRAVDSTFFGLTYGPNFLPRSGYFALKHLNKIFPAGSEFEVQDDAIAVSADAANMDKASKLYGAWDPHSYLFRKADGAYMLFVWNAGWGRDRAVELPYADIRLPFEIVPGTLAVNDLFLGSDRKWYTLAPETAKAENADGGAVIRRVKYYDSPVMLEFRKK